MFGPCHNSIGSDEVVDCMNDATMECATPGNGRLVDVWDVGIILSISKDPFKADPKVDQDLGHLGCRQALRWECIVQNWPSKEEL